jgi:hypothetical protein
VRVEWDAIAYEGVGCGDGAVSVLVTLPVAMFHRYAAPLKSPAARVSSGPNATELTTLPPGSVSLPAVVRVLAGCSWETAAEAAGDRGYALCAEDGCMYGVGCCWLSSSGAIRAR